MIVKEPNIKLTNRYPIGEAADVLGISRGTLREHTTLGHIRCGWRRTNKRRFYTGAEILRYWRASV